ncbi:helix-turn-helix transcriptional regulator, partial [Salinispora arenicola]|uniref:helix-turn-helix transcriptional regulator n=1 Tax=Salinispora arenicola TaxID=168697 RepID=UPI0027DE3482
MLALLRDTSRKSITHAAAFAVDGFILECTLNLRTLSDRPAADGARRGASRPPRSRRRCSPALRREDKAPVYAPFLLTPREHEVLQLLSAGLTNKQIARHLQISDHGAKRHVANVLAKM